MPANPLVLALWCLIIVSDITYLFTLFWLEVSHSFSTIHKGKGLWDYTRVRNIGSCLRLYLLQPNTPHFPWSLELTKVHACVCAKSFNRGWLCAMLWATACQAPLSMGFSRQEYLSGLPCPAPGDLPDPGIEPESLTYPALASRFFTTSTTWEPKVLSLPQAHLTIPYFLVLLSSSFQPRSLMQYCLPARSLVPPARASLSIHHFICNLGMSHPLP